MMRIYHNPRCAKSRETLKLLTDKGVEPEVIEYLKTPPTANQLRIIISKLGISPDQLVRKGEKVYKEQYKGVEMTEEDWINAMVNDPILIERPIVETELKAVIGRPPQNIEGLF